MKYEVQYLRAGTWQRLRVVPATSRRKAMKMAVVVDALRSPEHRGQIRVRPQ